MSVNLWQNSWPLANAAEAIQALAAFDRLPCRAVSMPQAPRPTREGNIQACRTWIESTAAYLGIEASRKQVTYGAMTELLRDGPSLVQINFEEGSRLLALVGNDRGGLTLIPPSLVPAKISSTKLKAAIANSLERDVEASLAGVLESTHLAKASRQKVLRAMIDQRLRNARVAEAWKLEVPASAKLWTHAQRAGLPRNLVAFLSAYGVEYGLWIVSWFLVGKWAFEGRFDTGWLLGWALLLLTLIPIHMFAMWEQAKLTVSGAGMVMRLLLEGSFKLNPEEVRYAGVGQLLARVLDSEALQSLALNGGLLALVAIVELIFSAAIIAIGARAWYAAGLLILWIACTAGLAFVYHHHRRAWTSARLDVTQELTERMIGHRTRLAQQPPERWHGGEDESIAEYVKKSRTLDWLNTICLGLVPRGWLIVGVAAMAPALVSESQSPGILAAQLGGILLAFTALQRFSSALATLSGAAIAAERAKDMLQAAGRTEPPGDPAIAVAADSSSAVHLLEMRDVNFRYPHRAADAIKSSFVELNTGDRVLLRGHSGSGKSTWVALASGIRLPDSGLLFLGGIDRKTLGGRDWRRRVVAAPQFHENHIFTASLGFNLLIGRRWPAEAADIAEAETICRELGLGQLLDAMPGGIMQMVGETGWQLSNGEKSRVYLARTLLQRAEIIILDETIAALDPESARQAMQCVLRRAKTAVCVAHV
jgi:ATP-binding cassette, subfamily B, bacterial